MGHLRPKYRGTHLTPPQGEEEEEEEEEEATSPVFNHSTHS
jgi:hypothetical protein